MTQDSRTRGTAGAALAAAFMVIAGVFGILQGYAGVAKGTFYVQPAHYWITTSTATWGWWHIIVSFIVLAAGAGILVGVAAARWIGIIFVGLQAVTNFLFIPYQPIWALVLIAIDLWIIHSLFVHHGPLV